MSRIDKALNIWEGSAAVEDRPAGTSARDGAAFALTEYPPEPGGARAVADVVPYVPPRVAAAPVRTRRVHGRAAGDDLPARLVTGGATSVTLEQYRRLAATLHDAQVERGLKTLMVTSAVPGEGKTLTVTNLGLTLSESFQRRVLLIDADLRLPTLHTMFGLDNTRGLSEALSEAGSVPTLIEVSDRLSMMSAGQPGQTPLANLASERMGSLLQECAGRFDWVIVDTSPVGVIPDGQVLARLIGAVILVINAGSTPAAVVERTAADLGAEYILGTVLNRVDERRIPEAGYYATYGAVAHRA